MSQFSHHRQSDYVSLDKFVSFQFFNNMLMLGKQADSEVSNHLYELIYELNQVSANILLAVIPQLEFKLKVILALSSDTHFFYAIFLSAKFSVQVRWVEPQIFWKVRVWQLFLSCGKVLTSHQMVLCLTHAGQPLSASRTSFDKRKLFLLFSFVGWQFSYFCTCLCFHFFFYLSAFILHK